MLKFLKVCVLLVLSTNVVFAESSLRDYFFQESTSNKNDDIQETRELTLDPKKIEHVIYVGLLASNSKINIDRTDSAIAAYTDNLDEFGTSLSLELGFKYTKSMDFVFTYQRVDLDNLALNNLYISNLYYFGQERFRPYLGASVGYSNLTWDSNVNNSENVDLKSSSTLYGVTFGAEYKMNEDFLLNLNYQINKIDHESYFDGVSSGQLTNSTLNHNMLNTVGVGIRYLF
jgi:opacity protein-like surface antigen